MTVVAFRNGTGKPVGTPTPRQQRVQSYEMPAPIGMNTMTPIADLPSTDCIYTYNLLPYELGLQTREGYRTWSDGFTPADSSIRTIIPFNGNTSTNDRLFAANDQGIYNITARSGNMGAPADRPSGISWPTTGAQAGYVTWTHFTNDAGAHFLIAADESNGLYQYAESTGTWTAMTGINGVTETEVFFVMSHKQRLWLITRAGDVYYLPINSIAGQATRFNVDANFREGGNASGLYSWTVDGGDGVDDYFVAVSREGGVVIYRGNDPANAGTWGLVGVWYVGRLPAGNRAGSQYGGQLFLLSEHGLVNLNRLIEGGTLQDASNVSTDKITRIVREDLIENLGVRGWEIKTNAPDNHFYILSPDNGNAPRIQYVRNMTTNGWGLMRGVPMATGDVFQGNYYFADPSAAKIYQKQGTLDDVDIDDNGGREIEFSMLTSFQGNAQKKRVQWIRPHFISSRSPAFAVQARYDYDLSENNQIVEASPGSAALWDQAIWDNAQWVGGIEASESLRGATGIGQAVAIALRGEVTDRAVLAAIDVIYEPGGFL